MRLPARARHARRQHYIRLKSEVLAAYGTVCQCCGESEFAFLSIDHVNRDGARHRRRHQLRSGYNTYLWLKRRGYPSGFQVLCLNCNNGRRWDGVCPHQARGVYSAD